ncbi:KTSC domain-containing protein [Stutzerimonas nosocomialis]|uniref:KTSC domain-containing protein n=1 Tax=Stutzerimonas nosocomialis TaxID=1056496 RepID=UPI0011085E92|nr:KTSC domain-containing protein [Stutzerimonas nosocomialis]
MSARKPRDGGLDRKGRAKRPEPAALARVRVESESLRSVGYDPDSRILEVEFQGDGLYRYEDVPPEVVLELLEAESMGTYFNQVFKARGHRYRRLD